ncbi:hypothetical protein [Flagellimonas sp. C4]|uniref:XAC2610-related protein n=1 Tax=Flagellimonas alginolytica TaxID=3177515 RepID=UPI0035C8B5DD
MSEKKDSISFLIYFKHTYGDQLEKILRVKRPDSIFDITLAMSGGDGQDTYTISTEFVNDSIFKKTFKHEQTEKDNTHLMAYGIDSIITTYKYNMGFDLKEIKKDSFHIYKELPIFHKNLIGKSFKVRSLPFEINGLNCQWEYIVRYSESINSKSEKILVDLLGQKLVEFTTERVLLDLDLDQFYFVYNPIDLSSLDYNKNIFRNKARKAMYSYTNDSTDINLDGHYDFKFFTESAGGGANESYLTYLFHPELRVFELSEIFSGANLTFDADKNRISTWGKSGVDNYFYRYINLKPNRKDIEFIETAHRYGDTIFYEKNVDSVVVLKKKLLLDNTDGWESWLERN